MFTLLAIAFPASAEELQEFVAGTEFEPNPLNQYAAHPFYLKEQGNPATGNGSLEFFNPTIFQQDIVVYDNVSNSSSLVHINQNYNLAKYGYTAANSTTVPINKYIVAKPSQVNKVGGLAVRKNDGYSNNGMFITKTTTGQTTCILYYTITNLKEGEAYQVKIGFVNLADKDNNAGSLAVKLRYKIHGIKNDGTVGGQLIENEWNLNTGLGIKDLQTKSSQIIKEEDMKNYTGLVLTILNTGSEDNHVFGLDYINVYSKNNIVVLDDTETPLSMNYDECVETPGKDIDLSSQVRLPKGYTGILKIYKDPSLTQLAPKTFNTGTPTDGPVTYYYTYQEEGKNVSPYGTFTINVKPNEKIDITASPSNATITCSNQIVTLSGPASTTQYEWTTPNGDTGLGNNFQATSAGTYKIKGTGSNSCPANGSIQVIENKVYPTITALTSKNSKNEVSKDITCDEDVLTITPTVSSTNVTYSWSGPDNFNKTTKTISVDKPGTYTLVVKDKTTGCLSEPLSITIEDKTKKPVIDETHIKNVSGKDVLDGALTCTNEVLVLSADITCDNPVSYSWTGPNNFSKTSAQVEVTAKGTYKLVVIDTKTGCQSDEREFYIQENKDKPVIEKIVATNSAGEETNIVTCTDGTLTITPTVSMRDVSYKWDNNKTTASITETAAGTYTLVVTNNTNGCSSEPKSITLTKDESVPTVTVKSFDSLEPNATEVNTLTCTYPELYIVADVEPTDVKYYWNGSENIGDSYLKVTEPATYTLKVVSNVNGCVLDGIEYEIKQDTIKPVVKLRPQYKLDGSEGSTEFTCERKNIILEADTEESKVEIISYKWSSSTDTFNWTATNEPGEYSVTVVAKNGCEATSSITLTENVVLPDITVTSLDSKGEPRTLLTCEEPEVTLNITLNNEGELGNDGPVRYFWLFPETDGGVELQSIKMQSPTLCRAELVGPNGCITTKDIQLTEDKGIPVATLTQTAETITCSVPNVTISATTDIEADYEWYFDGKTYTDVTEINADKGGDGYLVVTSKTSGCSQAPYMFTVNQSTVVPEVPVIDDAKLALCPNTGIVNLTSFIQSPSADVQYTFYNEQGEKVGVTEVNTNVPNMTYTYEVTATATNGCVSDDAEFELVVDGLIDFELETSSTRVMVGGEETKVTVLPSGVVADTYVWELNGEKVSADGTEYTTRLYVDTKYVVTGISRCETKTDDVSIEVVWPTAFTPHNQNGKNDDFAKGLPIIVFNRFYTKIFEGPDGWDGTINGSMNNSKDIAVPGVYYYAVTLPNGDIKKGTIEIIKVD